jgi:isoquinoline 1-oxidoreductase alpha subunit
MMKKESERMITLNVDGTVHRVAVDPETPLLWVLREQLGLIGTKYSCGIGECGACNVLIDGSVVKSCTIGADEVRSEPIITIEGLQGAVAEALFKAWEEGDNDCLEHDRGRRTGRRLVQSQR